jgi:hypothetical protein
LVLHDNSKKIILAWDDFSQAIIITIFFWLERKKTRVNIFEGHCSFEKVWYNWGSLIRRAKPDLYFGIASD